MNPIENEKQVKAAVPTLQELGREDQERVLIFMKGVTVGRLLERKEEPEAALKAVEGGET